MATIEEAIVAKVLEPYELPDWEERVPVRCLYVALGFHDELTDEFYSDARKIAGRTLDEHLDQAFCDFRCGNRPFPPELRILMPHKLGIWKMHPNGLRVYGWCPQPHTFVAVTWNFADLSHEKGATDAKRKQVQAFCRRHKLENTIHLGTYDVLFP